MPQKIERILLVEDDPMVRRSIDMLLNHLGHVVETAEDGATALTKLASTHFTLVLADLYMPGMKGDELAREIKRLKPDLPVILITGSAGSQIPSDFAGVLRKPFSIEELRAILKSIAARPPGPAPRTASTQGDEAGTNPP